MEILSDNKPKLNKSQESPRWFFALLCIAASEFLALGSYIFLVAVILFALFRHLRFPVQSGMLFLFAIAYAITLLFHDNSYSSAAKIIVCPLLWCVGYSMPDNKRVSGIVKVAVVLAMGMAAHGLINYAYNIAIGTDMSGALKYDFWSQSISAATGQATNFTILEAMSVYLIFLHRNKGLRFVALVVFIAALLYDIQIGGRSFFVLLLIAVVVSLLAYSRYALQERTFSRRALPAILLLIVLILIGWFLFSIDFAGVRTAFESGYLYRRFFSSNSREELVATSRWELKGIYLRFAPRYLFGGGHIQENHAGMFAHDIWLDTYDAVGLIPFLLLCVYTVSSVSRFFKMTHCSDVPSAEKALFLSMVATFMAQFFVEPIWQGSPILFFSYVMIDGMLAGYLADKERNHDRLRI